MRRLAGQPFLSLGWNIFTTVVLMGGLCMAGHDKAYAVALKTPTLRDTADNRQQKALYQPGTDSQPLQPLKIGDKVPDIYFQMLNYESEGLKLSQLKGKLVILDFWATWCSSCIAAFPGEEELKKKFGDRVEFLLVNSTRTTGDGKKKVEEFLDKQKTVRKGGVALPVAVNDSLADALFPHRMVPYLVWINQQGVVINTTGPEEVNEKNVNAVLEGRPAKILNRDDDAIFDFKKPYLASSPNYDGLLLFNSTFSRALPNEFSLESSRGGVDENAVSYKCYNRPLRFFYELVYPYLRGLPQNRIEALIKDSSILREVWQQSADDKISTLNYSYEFYAAAFISREDIFEKFLKTDLDRIFPYVLKEAIKRKDCLVLKEISTTSSKDNINASATKDLIPVSEVITQLNNIYSMPVLDETGLSAHRFVKKQWKDIHDMDAIVVALKASGLAFETVSRDIKVMVITENK